MKLKNKQINFILIICCNYLRVPQQPILILTTCTHINIIELKLDVPFLHVLTLPVDSLRKS